MRMKRMPSSGFQILKGAVNSETNAHNGSRAAARNMFLNAPMQVVPGS